MLNWELEDEYYAQGYKIICGTDEAGRGPLAGPVYAAAVILPCGLEVEGLNDSKKISEKKRERLYDVIRAYAVSYAVASVGPAEIDRINILSAAQLAMRQAVAALDPAPDLTLVDGNVARDFPMRACPIVKGDAKSPNIAAASILAKVERDRYCLEMDARYPEYRFAVHKGYPTKEHMDLLRTIGPCPEHRKTFLKFLDK